MYSSCEFTDKPTMMTQIDDDHDRTFETLGKSDLTAVLVGLRRI